MPHVAVKDGYTLLVEQDDCADNPRETDDCFGTMVCFHRRYSLGDKHSYNSHDDFLQSLFIKSVGNEEKGERLYEKLEEKYYGSYPAPRGADRDFDNALLEQIIKNHVVLPLYLYDHSGISISTGSFVGRAQHAEWDSGIVGWVYASKEAILNEYGGKNLTATKREKAEKLMEAEVEYYDSYLRGDCYGFRLFEGDVEVDSCWGFIGSLEELKADIESHLPQECRGITAHLNYEYDTPAPSLETILDFNREKAAQPQPPQPSGKTIAAAAR